MESQSVRDGLLERWRAARRETEALCLALEVEDYCVQPEEDVSPPKWHLAHTTWFFETFLLGKHLPGYRPRDPSYAFLFNSYYEAAGARAPRGKRGDYSRPTVAEVYAYRKQVDAALEDFLGSPAGNWAEIGGPRAEIRDLIELGLNHEQQHQELLLTDIKRILHFNPSRPAYRTRPKKGSLADVPPSWVEVEGGLKDIGWEGKGFAFDNEKPRHKHFLVPFRIEDRAVSNSRYLAFIADGGYDRPDLWLSEGWRISREGGWRAPLYWEWDGAGWSEYTLEGLRPLRMAAPVCHVSYFEADAFARWSGARLPTEQEWEVASRLAGLESLRRGSFAEEGALHPDPASASAGFPLQMLGDVWEWTASAYLPYPGFRPFPGAVGEYNGKFMMDQMVLRGGSCATPRSHIRNTYRNFFPAGARWQFSGIRLAETKHSTEANP